MGYTVKDVKSIIENLDDDTPLFGFILGPKDGIEVPESEDTYREPTAEEWANIVTKADELALRGSMSIWDAIWETINDARSEVYPDVEEGENCEECGQPLDSDGLCGDCEEEV